MPDAKERLPHDIVREEMLNVAPTDLAIAYEDIRWLVEHDEEHRSILFWLGAALVVGAATKKRTMENTFAIRQAKAEKNENAKNLELFTKNLLLDGTPLTEARAGKLDKILKLAAAFHIPVDVVLGFINPPQPKQDSAEKKDATKAA